MILLSQLFEDDVSLLVFAPFVLKPDPDDPRVESSHFNQLFLHQGVWSWIDRVASSQGVQLSFVENCSHSGCLSLCLEWIAAVVVVVGG